MARVDTGERVRTSEKTGLLMGAVGYRVPAITLERVGSETLKATFMEPGKTLAVASNKIIKATYTGPARTSGKDGNMIRTRV